MAYDVGSYIDLTFLNRKPYIAAVLESTPKHQLFVPGTRIVFMKMAV